MSLEDFIEEQKSRVTVEAATIVNSLKEIKYLGDSVYVGTDGLLIWLYTDNGVGPSNIIGLEPGVYFNLNEWARGGGRNDGATK